MPKTKKLLISSVALITTLAPITTMVSCGSKDVKDVSSNYTLDRRDLRYLYRTPDGKNGYTGTPWQFMPRVTTTSNGSLMHELLNASSTGAFRKVVEGSPQYDSEGNLTNGESLTEYLKFEVAKAIEVVHMPSEGGIVTTTTFDSDSKDINESASINSKAFENLLNDTTKKITAINVVFPEAGEGAKWVNFKDGHVVEENGNPVEVGAEDYWYTIQHSIYSNHVNREAEITSGKLTSLNTTSSVASWKYPWTKDTSASIWTNGGATAYGLNLEDFVAGDDEAKAKFTEGNKANFKFNNPSSNQVKRFWNDIFKNSGGYKLISANQIKKSVEHVNSSNDGDIIKLKNELGTIATSKTYKYGVYQLRTQNIEAFQTAGQYYLAINAEKEAKVVKNSHYIDQTWVSAQDTVNSFAYDFTAEANYWTTGFATYEQGSNFAASLDYSKNPSAYTKALQNISKYGVKFNKGFDGNATKSDYTMLMANPLKSTNYELDSKFNYYFSDAYAKAMYGGTIDDFAAAAPTEAQLAIRKNAYKHFFAGKGYQFRTALRAAYNENHATYQWNPNFQEWNSRFAPDQEALYKNGTNETKQNFIDYKTTLEGSTQHNPITTRNYYSLDANGKLVKEGEVTSKEYNDVRLSSADNDAKFLAPTADLDKIKTIFTSALSDLSSSDKIRFELPVGRGVWGSAYNLPVYQPTKTAFNKLLPTSGPQFEIYPELTPQTIEGDKDATPITGKTDYTATWGLFKDDGTTTNHASRLHIGGVGTGAFSIFANNLASFPIDSPAAPILMDLDYLQDGMIFALSLAQAGQYDGTPLAPIKKVSTVLDGKIKSEIAKAATLTPAELGYKSSIGATLKADLLNLDLAKVYQSDFVEVSNFGYTGFESFTATREAVRAARDAATAQGATDEVKAAFKAIQDDLKQFDAQLTSVFDLAMYELDTVLQGKTIAEQFEIYDAWDEMAPHAMNVRTTSIGNRKAPAPSLMKTFVKDNFDVQKRVWIGSWKIDK